MLSRPEVERTNAELSATFAFDDHVDVADDAHLPAVVETVTLLPAMLRAGGIELTELFAASAAHFEGWGAREVLETTISSDLLARLADHGELPEE